MEVKVVALYVAFAVFSAIFLTLSSRRSRRLRNIKKLKEDAFARDIKLMIRREHDDKIIEKNRESTRV